MIALGVGQPLRLGPCTLNFPELNKILNLLADDQVLAVGERYRLESADAGDVWGVGRQYRELLRRYGIRTARELRDAPDAWVRRNMTITGLRTVWELRGVPLRIEIGPRDVENQAVVLARRDVPGKPGKSSVAMDGLADSVGAALEAIQADMLAAATAFRDANIHTARSYEELKEIVSRAWARAYWCGDPACEAQIKEETKASSRNIPLDQGDAGPGACVVCGRPAQEWAYWARAY